MFLFPVYLCVCVYVCLCMCVCVCVWSLHTIIFNILSVCMYVYVYVCELCAALTFLYVQIHYRICIDEIFLIYVHH